MIRAVDLHEVGSRKHFNPVAMVQASPFVGADLTQTPHSSAYGTLARLVRLNCMRPSGIAPLLGIRTQRTQNLAAIMTFSEAKQAKLAAALLLSDPPASWNLSIWFPFSASPSVMSEGWQFRYCPDCLRCGYHAHLHQLPWFGRCPWHGSALSTTCPTCRTEVDTSANWIEGRDMTCQCGHTLIDTSAAIKGTVTQPVGASAFLDAYLDWAAQERAAVTLAARPRYSTPVTSLRDVVELPRKWHPWAAHVRAPHTRTWVNTGHPAPGALQVLEDLDTLRRDRPGFLKLSQEHATACAQVAAKLALKLPEATLSDGEMTLFLAGTGIQAPPTFKPARRPFSPKLASMVPWQTSAGDFLNLTCLHPASYRPIVDVFDAIIGMRTMADFHAQARAGEVDLLLRCCRDILARGYAEGLRSLLAPHVPALFEMRRDRPHLSQPLLLVRRTKGTITSIRAIWEPLNFSGRQEHEAIQEADDANKRRERYQGRPRNKA